MLVLLLAVTTIFLLVMGTVSTVVLSRHLGSQFNANLIAAAARRPADLAAHPNGYAAVQVNRTPPFIHPLTGGATTQELRAAVFQLIESRGLRAQMFRARPFSLPAPGGGAELRAVMRPVARVRGGGLLVVAQPVSAVTRQVTGFIITELITGGALIALLAIGGHWLIRRGLDPLARMARTASAITSSGDLTARMPGGGERTEVGSLAAAINTMLDRIQQAFSARLRSEQKVREFAADASHELRTPLTTIRGYAELYRQGALGPGQLPAAMRRIEQEATRMGTLVAELLELARLDRTSSLDLAETDLAGLVRDAVADASAVEPSRPVRAETPQRLVAVVDEARMRQVLANLLANVRAHTPETASVTVRLASVREGVLIEVADTGPGMTPAQAARAFDRFYRARENGRGTNGTPGTNGGSDPAGDAGTGGSGLGLSIVQAIARAHGGDATLESRPGRGTSVRVWLPVSVLR
jgi:signal transduction histidine kinase